MATLLLSLGTGSVALSFLLKHHDEQYLLHASIWKTSSILFCAILLIFATWEVVVYPKLFEPLRKLPGPIPESFFHGQFWKFMREEKALPIAQWQEEIPNDGLLYYTSMFNRGRVALISPKALAEVLNHKSYDFVKPSFVRENISRVLGIGVLFAEGDEHKRQRKHLTPAFSFRHVKELYPIFWSKAQEMISMIESSFPPPTSPSNENASTRVLETEAGNWCNRTTLDVIGVAGMGKDFSALSDPDNQLYGTYNSLFNPSGVGRFILIASQVVPFSILRSLPLKRNKEVKRGSEYIRQFAQQLINEKKTKLGNGENMDRDILSVALESGGFDDENLIDQMMTFLAAGHETTASGMQWAIYHLCKDKSIQSRLRTELRDSVHDIHDREASIKAEDLETLPYLNAFCNEILRFHPPITGTQRVAVRDTNILGVPIPKGTSIILSLHATNRSKELWGADATSFDPDRWLTKSSTNNGENGREHVSFNPSGGATSNYAFMTFLHGPRSCIGSSFARAEFLCLVAGWVMAFEMELQDESYEAKPGSQVSSKPKGGVNVRLRMAQQ